MASDSKLTIVHSLAPAAAGGLESVVRMLAEGQHRSGHRVIIAVTVDNLAHPFMQSLAESGIHVVSLVIGKGGYRQERRFVEKILRDVTPDVLHTHGYRPDLIDLGVGRSRGVGTVTTLHGFTGGDWKVRLYERLQLRAIRQADAVVAVSQGVYNRVCHSGVKASKVYLIRNAYESTSPPLSRTEARQALGIPRHGTRLGWIGRLSTEKGPDVMIEALGHLRDPSVTLSFIGEGPDQRQLAARVEALGLQGQVQFHGLIAGAARLLPAFDALVLSSRTEGTPMVILEAMAAESPIIAARVGGIPDMLSAEEAMLVAPENPEALAAAIRDTLGNPAAAATRAGHARKRLTTQFGIAHWLSKYDSLYRTIRQ